MKKFLFTFSFILTIILSICFNSSIKAQSLEETISKLTSTVGSAYVNPIISAFGSNLNSGWVSKVPSATKLGFHIDVKIVAMGSFFSDDVKNFVESSDFFFNGTQTNQILAASNIYPTTPGYQTAYNQIYNQKFTVTFSGPTIVGSENQALNVRFPGIQSLGVQPYNLQVPEVKGLVNMDDLPLKAFPTAAAQLTIGTVAGTNVSFRYFPSVDIQDLGKFSFFGFGGIHNPGVWFPNPLPLDLGVGFFTQTLKVGDIFESTASQFGVYASKTIGMIISITPYAGLTYETSKTTVKYEYQSNQTVNGVPVPPTKINFELEGNNSTAIVIGFNIHLAAVNINADYKIAKTKTASVGVSLGW